MARMARNHARTSVLGIPRTRAGPSMHADPSLETEVGNHDGHPQLYLYPYPTSTSTPDPRESEASWDFLESQNPWCIPSDSQCLNSLSLGPRSRPAGRGEHWCQARTRRRRLRHRQQLHRTQRLLRRVGGPSNGPGRFQGAYHQLHDSEMYNSSWQVFESRSPRKL